MVVISTYQNHNFVFVLGAPLWVYSKCKNVSSNTFPVLCEIFVKTPFDMFPIFSESSIIVSPPVSTRPDIFNSSKLSKIFSLSESSYLRVFKETVYLFLGWRSRSGVFHVK